MQKVQKAPLPTLRWNWRVQRAMQEMQRAPIGPTARQLCEKPSVIDLFCPQLPRQRGMRVIGIATMETDFERKKRLRKEIYRRYYLRNKERRNAAAKAWRLKNLEKHAEANRRWKAENPGVARNAKRKWALRNAETLKAKSRIYRAKNAERLNAQRKLFREANKERLNAQARERMRRLRARTPVRVTRSNNP